MNKRIDQTEATKQFALHYILPNQVTKFIIELIELIASLKYAENFNKKWVNRNMFFFQQNYVKYFLYEDMFCEF